MCSWIERLSLDNDPFVRKRFREHTLYTAVPLHLNRLKDYLKRIATYPDMPPVISDSLAVAYLVRPRDVGKIITEWHEECLTPSAINMTSSLSYDYLFETVILCYGKIQWDERQSSLSFNEIFQRLTDVLDPEESKTIREASILAISYQAERHLSRIEKHLEQFVVGIPKSEQQKIAKVLTNIYLKQRKQMTGGDTTTRVESGYYQTFTVESRELTDVEIVMRRWIINSKNPEAVEIALRVSISCALALDLAENQRIIQVQEERQRIREALEAAKLHGSLPEHMPSTAAIATMGQGESASTTSGTISYIERIILWWATRRASQYRINIYYLLPEISFQLKKNPDAMNFLIRKWSNSSDIKLNELMFYLKKIIGLLEKRVIITIRSLLLILILLIAIIIFIVSYL